MGNLSTPQEILQTYFGHAQFRLNQAAIIETILLGKEVLAILPTGGGKSICYQVPGLALGGVTLVISPLISLMKDQVDQLNKRNISAAYLNSSLSQVEQDQFFTNFTQGKIQFVYVAPERLLAPKFLEVCKKNSIRLVAVDESHCVSQWGHDFRPAYVQIKQFLDMLPDRPRLLALTATATDATRLDIIKSVGMSNPITFINSFQRTNLSLFSHSCKSETEKQLRILRAWKELRNQKVILYCATRDQTVRYAQLAQHFGYSCGVYHAGLTSAERSYTQQQFTAGQIQMIAATNAFGMGIDIPDIRAVFHTQVPHDLEGYYQEVGRAGRDGKRAQCYLFYTSHDQQIQNKLFLRRFPLVTEVKQIYSELLKIDARKKVLEQDLLETIKQRFPDLPITHFFHVLHVLEILQFLERKRVKSQTYLYLLKNDPAVMKNWLAQRARAEARITSVQRFLTQSQCRTQAVLSYFGETMSVKCQNCDLCQVNHFEIPEQEKNQRQHLLEQFRSDRGKFSCFFSGQVSQSMVKYLALFPEIHQSELIKMPGAGQGFVSMWKRLFPI